MGGEGAVSGIVGAIFALFTIGLFTFYLTANGPKVRHVLLSRVRPDRQGHILWAWETAIEKTGGYLYSRGLLALINGGLMYLILKIVGTPSRCRWRCSRASWPSSSLSSGRTLRAPCRSSGRSQRGSGRRGHRPGRDPRLPASLGLLAFIYVAMWLFLLAAELSQAFRERARCSTGNGGLPVGG